MKHILPFPDYEFIDCGDGRRLERFAGVLVDRPAPQAVWPCTKTIPEWQQKRAYYGRTAQAAGWQDVTVLPENWQIQMDAVRLELKASENNQIGIFPEQLDNWSWLKSVLQKQKRPVQVLNGFAYTGAATLMASASGTHVSVCHVDGAKSAVSWAKRNAEISGLSARPIRWIVDDVLTFLAREIKRGQKYDAFILDPPAFGRAGNKDWKLERDLPQLMQLVNELLSDKPCFVILSCHAPEISLGDLAAFLQQLKVFCGHEPEVLELNLKSKKGKSLPSSLCARVKSK